MTRPGHGLFSRPDMAETKTEAKSKAKPKAAAEKKPTAAKTKAAAAVESKRGMCTAGKCKFPLRAKGYCRKHFLGWRRGELGKKHRYKVCSKEGCRKPRAHGGLCEEHSGKGKPAEGGGAA